MVNMFVGGSGKKLKTESLGSWNRITIRWIDNYDLLVVK